MRAVAQYMAELLNELNDKFKAKEFTSTGPSAEEGGMLICITVGEWEALIFLSYT